MNEDKVLEWLLENKSTGDDDDVIEDVTVGLLNSLIDSMDHLAVIFCESQACVNTFCKLHYDNKCQYILMGLSIRFSVY